MMWKLKKLKGMGESGNFYFDDLTNKTTQVAAIPSSLPINPNPSVVVALIDSKFFFYFHYP